MGLVVQQHLEINRLPVPVLCDGMQIVSKSFHSPEASELLTIQDELLSGVDVLHREGHFHFGDCFACVNNEVKSLKFQIPRLLDSSRQIANGGFKTKS